MPSVVFYNEQLFFTSCFVFYISCIYIYLYFFMLFSNGWKLVPKVRDKFLPNFKIFFYTWTNFKDEFPVNNDVFCFRTVLQGYSKILCTKIGTLVMMTSCLLLFAIVVFLEYIFFPLLFFSRFYTYFTIHCTVFITAVIQGWARPRWVVTPAPGLHGGGYAAPLLWPYFFGLLYWIELKSTSSKTDSQDTTSGILMFSDLSKWKSFWAILLKKGRSYLT